MKLFTLTAAAAVLAVNYAAAAAATDTADDFGPWTGTLLLAADIDYSVSWKIDTDTITLKLRAATTAWLGFGLGEFTSGSMLGADIVTVSVDDQGRGDAVDRHVPWTAFPLSQGSMPYPDQDTCQDWVTRFASEEAEDGTTYTTVVVTRKLVTDDIEDRPVVAGPMRVIFAFGVSSKDSVAYHGGRRGATVIDFGQVPISETTFLPDDVDSTKTIELLFGDYELPIQKTTYACETFNVTDMAFGEDIIVIEPVIDPASIDHAHHMLIHSCEPGSNSEFENNPAQCNSPLLTKKCKTMLYAWAKGGSEFVLPLNVAFRGVSQIVIEIHYDNVVTSGKTDASGIRIYAAKAPREHEGTGLTLGLKRLGQEPDLPAGTEEVHRQTTCNPSCTGRFTGEVNVFASFLHMHNYGKQTWTSLYDSAGDFKTTLNRIDFWNGGFQQVTSVEHKISPGDSMQTHCVYDTTRSADDVAFGAGTGDEMCFDFLFVYPKSNVGDVTGCGTEFYPAFIGGPDLGYDSCYVPEENEDGVLYYDEQDLTPKSEGDYPLTGDQEGTFAGSITTDECSAEDGGGAMSTDLSKWLFGLQVVALVRFF